MWNKPNTTGIIFIPSGRNVNQNFHLDFHHVPNGRIYSLFEMKNRLSFYSKSSSAQAATNRTKIINRKPWLSFGHTLLTCNIFLSINTFQSKIFHLTFSRSMDYPSYLSFEPYQMNPCTTLLNEYISCCFFYFLRKKSENFDWRATILIKIQLVLSRSLSNKAPTCI